MVRIVISDPEKGKAYQIEPEESEFEKIIGLIIGDRFEGETIGLQGYELEIRGGSDEEGFPMRKGTRGEGRTRPLLSGGSGYKPPEKGLRRRKTVRGSRISKNIAQLNTIITEHGDESLEKILGLETNEEKSEEEDSGE